MVSLTKTEKNAREKKGNDVMDLLIIISLVKSAQRE